MAEAELLKHVLNGAKVITVSRRKLLLVMEALRVALYLITVPLGTRRLP